MPAVRLSRYQFAAVHVDECGRKFLDVPDPISRRNRRTDITVIVGEGDSLFALAWRAFREMLDREQDIRPSGFYWVIGQINAVVDPTEPLPIGKSIRIPSVDVLNGEILAPPRFFSSKRSTA